MSDNHGPRPSALKHGGYSSVALFPWENAEEYAKLQHDLRDEWQPDGALEDDCVFTILTAMWRKRRIRERRNLQIMAALQEPQNEDLMREPPPFFEKRNDAVMYALKHRQGKTHKDPRARDEITQLLGLSSSLYGDVPDYTLRVMIGMSGEKIKTHLNREVPDENYPSPLEWARALKREIDEVLLPAAHEQAVLEAPDRMAQAAADFMTMDRIMEDIEAEERLDAIIDRATRRLAQAKMMKQLSGRRGSTGEQPAAPRLIEAPKSKSA